MTCRENLHSFHDGALNNMHPFSCVASEANKGVLHYNETIKDDNADYFREDMGTEITNFKEVSF